MKLTKEHLLDAVHQLSHYVSEHGGSGGKEIQPVIYSNDEREVGVWTDGKPLYQKTFIVDNPQAGGQTYNLNISNLEKVVEQFGTWTRRWEAYGSISSWTYNINAENEIMPSFQPQFQVLARARDSDGTFYIYYPTSGAYSSAVSQVRLTIQYTKTTDTAGSGIWTPSGVPAVHYSTDEQVVGTWTDGKTIYQKTYTNLGIVKSPAKVWFDIVDVGELNIDTLINCYANPGKTATMALNTLVDGTMLKGFFDTVWCLNTVTIQYTKTTN